MSSKILGPLLEIKKRNHKTFPLQILDNEGDPFDLTDVNEIYFTAKEEATESASEIFQCSKTGGDIVVQSPATDGKINVSVEPADTQSVDAGEKVYDIKVIDGSDNNYSTPTGILKITQDITQDTS